MTELLPELTLPPVSPQPAAAPAGDLAIARAHRALAEDRYEDALAAIQEAGTLAHVPHVALKASLLQSWAALALGDVDAALEHAQRGHGLASQPGFSDIERAQALYHLGCCRFKRAEVSLAISLFTLALDLCERTLLSSDRLRAEILEWRSRCYQNQREWEAARVDVEKALELATANGDDHASAHAYFQASIVAERTGDARMARFYAEEAEAIYRDVGDRRMLGRILNNLGCLLFLLDDETRALMHLEEAIRVALELGSAADVAQATSSTAQIHLRRGRPKLAEAQARDALGVLAGRVDFLDEIGNAQLVLGRALLDQGRFDEADAALREAEKSFEQLGSTSHRAAVLVARGDLDRARGDVAHGADHYRAAAVSLQDFHF